MDQQSLLYLLQQLRNREKTPEEVCKHLQQINTKNTPSANLDNHRLLRTGIPEAIFGASKTTEQLIEIIKAQMDKKLPIIATRVSPAKAETVKTNLPMINYHATARVLTGNKEYIADIPEKNKKDIIIITAGTSDLPVAEEAKITIEMLGYQATALYDMGVAGIHRIISQQDTIYRARVIIVAAGMEGALPSVVAGMTAAPVIGLPTSVGYGVGHGGFAALTGMLTSCAPGMAVVNIDNGFGAACMAASIIAANRK